jgi:hypothetical protein
MRYDSHSDSDESDQYGYNAEHRLPLNYHHEGNNNGSGSDVPSNEEDDDDEDEPMAPPDYSNVSEDQ